MTYEKAIAAAKRIQKYFVVCGVSWKGNTIKRDGKAVHCPHKHRSEATAQRCLQECKKTRPGKCPRYEIAEIIRCIMAKKKP